MAGKKSRAAVHVLLGTRKGGFILQSDLRRRAWKMKGPFFENSPVFHMAFDKRDGKTIYAAVNSGQFGPTVQRSRDMGKTWENATTPPRFAEGSEMKVENVWHVKPGLADEPNVVYAGTAPAALFRSDDGGDNWKLNANLNNHPTRPKWQPGAGGLCLHSIVLDPSHKKRMYVGISAVGVFKSEDAGQTWDVKNRNVRADFSPEKYPEFGQCVHKLVMDPNKPSYLYQQNHCGVYRSEDAAENWVEISKGCLALSVSRWPFTHTIRKGSMLFQSRGISSALSLTRNSQYMKLGTVADHGRNGLRGCRTKTRT